MDNFEVASNLEIESKNDRPLVSVGMLTYNHEKYIRTALDSILMQEVNFDYEIVIADDCSTDRTREIIMAYYEKNPTVIKPVFNERNLGGQENANVLRCACKGKYRMTLEGDDYWCDHLKMKKQVDFLENNPDYIAISGDFSCIDDNGKPCAFPWGDIKYTYCQGDEYTMEDLEQWLLPGHASSMCFRNIFAEMSEEELDYFHSLKILGDRRTSMYLLMNGRIKHEKEFVMIRRVLTQSKTSMTTLTKTTNWHARNFLWMTETERCVSEHFNKKIDLSPYKELRWNGALKVLSTNPTYSNFKVARYIYTKSGDRKHYRQIARGKMKEEMAKSINKRGRLKTGALIIKGSLKAVKKMFLITRTSKKHESELFEVSMGKQFL